MVNGGDRLNLVDDKEYLENHSSKGHGVESRLYVHIHLAKPVSSSVKLG